jgi:hypothetical protein
LSVIYLSCTAEEEVMMKELELFARDFQCELRPMDGSGRAGFHILPEVLYRLHGVHVTKEEAPGVWCLSRYDDATTQEDFLLMHLAHKLAALHDGQLFFGSMDEDYRIDVDISSFQTFEHYAEKIVAKDTGLVKQMKQNWIFTHRKRHIR